MLNGISRSGLISNTTPRSPAPRKMYNGGHTGSSNGRLMRTPKASTEAVYSYSHGICMMEDSTMPACCHNETNTCKCGVECEQRGDKLYMPA
jgi:hypothetical protein